MSAKQGPCVCFAAKADLTRRCGVGSPGHPPNYDEPRSWSQTQQYWPSTNSGCPGTRFCPDGESAEAAFSDVNVTAHALDTLAANAKDYQSSGTNFALFLGLHFPHQPWYTPKWAVDFYSPIAGQNSP